MFRLALVRLVATSRVTINCSKIITDQHRRYFLRNLSSQSNDNINQTKIPLGNINNGEETKRMGIQFRCKVCDHTLQKTFTRQSYEKGVVIIRCDSCENLHLIADNLGWFNDLTQDGKFKNITQMLQAKGETIHRVTVAPTDDQSMLKEEPAIEKLPLNEVTMLSNIRVDQHFILSQKLNNSMEYLLFNQKQTLITGSIPFRRNYSASSKINQIKNKELQNKNRIARSLTVKNGEIVVFTPNDRSHPRSEEIYAELDRLAMELIKDGHKFDASWISRPIRKDETYISVLCGHSEKLALAFHLIEQPSPSFIQITNNIRLCGDCHQFMKRVAKLRQCEIVIRDANRIHRFNIHGECSCKDYF